MSLVVGNQGQRFSFLSRFDEYHDLCQVEAIVAASEDAPHVLLCPTDFRKFMTDLLKRIAVRVAGKKRAASLGLALGGGGVRGLAHVGVLRVFEREGISVQAIAGSSMGAIVGATYALNPEFIHEPLGPELMELGISDFPGPDVTPRDRDSFLDRLRQFIDTERFLLDTLWGWGILPEEPIAESLTRLTLGKNLEEARIPVAAVAIDLLSGEKVVFRAGPAALALQASSAIPGFFPPVRHGEQLLADGAFVDVVPAGVVREMGADVVIAVDVDQEERRVEVHNGLEAFLRAVELCARHHKHHHLEFADLVIRPEFGEPIRALDFSKAEICLEAGLQAADRALPEVERLLRR